MIADKVDDFQGERTIDTEFIRAQLLNGGQCQPYINGILYNTICNCSKDSLYRELEDSWDLVGIFRGKEFLLVTDVTVTPNRVVFRRKAPNFYHIDNPWRDKGPHPWLPDLAGGVNDLLTAQLANHGGHGCPHIARRFRCRCGEFHVTADFEERKERLEAYCVKCHRRSVIVSLDDYINDFDSLPVLIPTLITSWLRSRRGSAMDDPFRNARYTSWFSFLRKPKPVKNLQRFHCNCGSDHITIDLGIEYPIASIDGWDFSWVTASAACLACKKQAIFFSVETSG